MNNDIVSASLIIKICGNTQDNNHIFTDNWNFNLGKYVFKKKNNNEVEVSFSFKAKLNHSNAGIPIIECPSENTRSFQSEEQKIETLLDLISLQIGCGLKIEPGSYSFSCVTSKSLPVRNEFLIEPPNLKILKKQYINLIKNKKSNKRLISSLRTYRRSLFENDPNECVPKFYSILEQLYGEGCGGNLINNTELSKLKEFINTIYPSDPLDTSSENYIKKTIIMERLKSIPLKSINEIMVEKIGLMNTRGEISDIEKRETLKFWRKGRNTPAHGDILPKRGEYVEELTHSLSSTVESFLYGEVTPKLIHYFLFEDGSIKQSFIKNMGKLIFKLDGYYYFPVRNDEVIRYLSYINNEIVKNYVIVVSADNILKIKKDGVKKPIAISSLNKEMAKTVKKIKQRLLSQT